MSVANIKTFGPSNEDQEVSNPLKPKKGVFKNRKADEKSLSPVGEMKTMSKGSWKTLVRERGKAQAQDVEMMNKSPKVGNKRHESIEDLIKAEGRMQKKACGKDDSNKSSILFNETAVTVRQHR